MGQKLISLLGSDQGINLMATSRGSSRVELTASLNYASLDVEQAGEIQNVIGKFDPDVVIHTAAMTQVDDCELHKEACWQANVKAVENVVNVLTGTKTHLIHLSTDFIFDGTKELLTEEDVPNPISFYGESKLAAEEIVMSADVSASIVRTVLVYGYTPGMSRSNLVLWVKASLESGKHIRVVNDQWRTPTLAEDLAKGCGLLTSSREQGIFNISGNDYLTPYQMAMQTAEYFELDATLIEEVDSSIFTQPAKRPPKTGFNIDKAKNSLGYNPHSFTEGLAIIASQLAAS